MEITELLAMAIPLAGKGFAVGALISAAFIAYGMAGVWRNNRIGAQVP
ncbi:hypothetical protein PQR62_02195 [Herbaspirillum lusitanum]|uniref:Uncharacterized protein n=1 Tax=Herbaspirillum lusitanum TaxID=213312 RepID=A0ABW9A5C7_9BURK